MSPLLQLKMIFLVLKRQRHGVLVESIIVNQLRKLNLKK